MTLPNKTVLHIVEPFLKAYNGHFYQFTRNIVESAAQQQLSSVVYADRTVNAAVAGEITVVPAFESFPLLKRRAEVFKGIRLPVIREVEWRLEFFRTSLQFFFELRRSLKFSSPKEVFYFSSFYPRMTFGFSWWYRQIPAKQRPVVVLHVHEVIRFGNRVQKFFASLSRIAGNRLAITSYCERAVPELGRLTSLPVFVLPIPLAHQSGSTAAPDLPDSFAQMAQGERCVLCPGDLRDEKGIPEICEAIDRLNRSKDGSRFKFIIHVASWSTMGNEQSRRCLEQLQSAGHANVFLLRDALSAEHYYALLRKADIALLPYRQRSYQTRISSVFAEVLAVGKPVVVTENTWMSDQLEQYGSGETVPDQSPEAIARALLMIHAQYERYAAEAAQKSAGWQVKHNGGAFVRALYGIVK